MYQDTDEVKLLIHETTQQKTISKGWLKLFSHNY